MNRSLGTLMALAAGLIFVLAGCQPVQDTRPGGATAQPEEITLYVGPELVDCVGVGPMKCMLVKQKPEDEYQYFYSQIEGFTFEAGYTYELRVLVTPLENVPADASSLKYTLIEVVSKEAVSAEGAAGDMAEMIMLEGPTWQLVSVLDASGALTTVPEGVESTATFADGAVSGSGGCNRYSAAYTVDGDTLAIMPGPMTMMACPEPQMMTEQALMAAFGVTASYQIADGSLELLDNGGEVVATFAVQEAATLTGVTWMATTYNNGRGAAVSLLADTEITALFGDDGSLTGLAGCNNYMTGYIIDGDAISIQPAATTRKMCTEPIMQQETEYLAALQSAATFSIQSNRLELRTADGALAAAYVVVE